MFRFSFFINVFYLLNEFHSCFDIKNRNSVYVSYKQTIFFTTGIENLLLLVQVFKCERESIVVEVEVPFLYCQVCVGLKKKILLSFRFLFYGKIITVANKIDLVYTLCIIHSMMISVFCFLSHFYSFEYHHEVGDR